MRATNSATALAALTLTLSSGALAQWPNCNPLYAKCPMKKLWPVQDYYVDFAKLGGKPPRNWTTALGKQPKFTDQGAEFTWNGQGDAPQMWTDFFVFKGRYDIVMKAAPGQGIVTNSVL